MLGRGGSGFVEGSKEFVGIDAGIVEIAPEEAYGVAANLHPVQRHYVAAYIRYGDEPPAGHLMDAGGTPALGAQIAVLKDCVVVIVPADMDSVRQKLNVYGLGHRLVLDGWTYSRGFRSSTIALAAATSLK